MSEPVDDLSCWWKFLIFTAQIGRVYRMKKMLSYHNFPTDLYIFLDNKYNTVHNINTHSDFSLTGISS